MYKAVYICPKCGKRIERDLTADYEVPRPMCERIDEYGRIVVREMERHEVQVGYE